MRSANGKPPVPIHVDRTGYTIHGRKYPRVTSILNCMAKPALPGWAAKCVAEFAVAHRSKWSKLPEADAIKLLKGSPWTQRDAAADRGTAVHKAVEAYVSGEALPDVTEDELACVIAAESFLRDNDAEVHAREITVYDPRQLYAGTCDLWCTIAGEDWLIDWKTSTGIYPEMALQLVAYSLARWAILGGEVQDWCGGLIDFYRVKLGVVHLRNDGYTLHEVVQDKHRLEDTWEALLRVHAWMKEPELAMEKRTA